MITCAEVDVLCIHKPELLLINASTEATPLIDWAKGQQTKAAVCEISEYMQRPIELIKLIDRIEAGNTPSPLQKMPVPPQIVYAGRWLCGNAPCSALRRVEVSGCGEVRCCRQGEPIGEVGDSREVLSKRLANLRKAAEQRRGCAECQNKNCPRCPFPGMEDEIYCQIMTRQKAAQRAISWLRIYSRLPSLVAFQRMS